MRWPRPWSFAETNVNAAFDLAQKLAAPRRERVLALQSEFAKSQMAAMQTQAKELGAFAPRRYHLGYPK